MKRRRHLCSLKFGVAIVEIARELSERLIINIAHELTEGHFKKGEYP